MKKDKGKEKREDICCIRCKEEGHDKEICHLFNDYFTSGAPNPLKHDTLPFCEVCRTRHRPGECYYMHKYVQTPTNIYCTFYKYMGYDEKDCRVYDLMHESSREAYRIQGELYQEGNVAQFNSPGRLKFNPHGGFRGRGRGGGMGQGRGKIIFYNWAQLGHLARDFQNPCTTCNYCISFDHVIEDCPILLAKVQERRGGTQQVQLISVGPHGEEPRVVVITRGGTVTVEDKVTLGNTTDGSRIKRASKKAPLFDPRKEKHTFEESRREFVGE
jgi:hypothetical protein